MNKEEILQRSRHETQKNKGDELETMNKDKSDHIASSLIFYFILLLNIFNYMNIISGTINIGSKAISLTGLLVSLIIIFIVVKLSCMFYFLKKKKYLIIDILMISVLVLTIWRLINECK